MSKLFRRKAAQGELGCLGLLTVEHRVAGVQEGASNGANVEVHVGAVSGGWLVAVEFVGVVDEDEGVGLVGMKREMLLCVSWVSIVVICD